MAAFRKFIETFGMDAPRLAKKGLGRKYKPGTFGVEIEFVPRGVDDEADSTTIDMDAAREEFRRQTNIPEDLEEWESDNPEPERPDRDDYKWNPADPFSNYWNIDKYLEGYPDEDGSLRNLIGGWINADPRDEGVRLPAVFVDLMRRLAQNVHYVGWPRERDIHFWGNGTNPFDSTEKFDKYANGLIKGIHTLWPDRTIQDTIIRWNMEFTEKTENYLKMFVERMTEFAKKAIDWHFDQARNIDEGEYRRKILTVFRQDMEDWRERHQEWKEEHDEVKEKWEEYDEDEAFDRWMGRNSHRFEVEADRSMKRSDEIAGWVRRLQQYGVDAVADRAPIHQWSVFEDGDNIEMASPIMTYKDFPMLKNVLDAVSGEHFTDSTGLHVHIGMPPNTDAFDLLSMAYLLDEKSVLAMTNRTQGALDQWSKTKDDLFNRLWLTLISDVYDNSTLMGLMRTHLNRYFGVNTIKAFDDHGTVEFRYLTANVIEDKAAFFKTINYFLMLPTISQGRSQFIFRISDGTAIGFARRPGGRVEVTKWGEKERPAMRKTPLPVSQLRQPLQPQNRLQQQLAQRAKAEEEHERQQQASIVTGLRAAPDA